eukprot:gene13230-27993_t
MTFQYSYWLLTLLVIKFQKFDAYHVFPTKTIFSSLSMTRTEKVLDHPLKVLVLGGTGFVGNAFIKEASASGLDIVSLSRRGLPATNSDLKGVTWVSGDAADSKLLADIVLRYGPFDACVHAVGLLLDVDSGLSSFNKFASGSGSIPTSDSTYNKITKQTAFAAIDIISNQKEVGNKKIPFIFISAAEAGWTVPAPVEWLERYLKAKRAVESKLLQDGNALRPIIFRPSLIWTWERPQALFSVVPFAVASLFLPFVDRPVKVDSLVKAMVVAISNENVNGIQRFKEIDQLST